ncbi:MAG: helix-turn-helix transcriptional regulator [Methylophaga sp.]|nr:helix-turn-helix transcriptional regulator [Methylophaga sp.]
MAKVTTTKALGIMLRDHRKHDEITQAELARLAGGIKQSTVSNFENNPAAAKVDTLFKLASALGLEIQLVEKQPLSSSGADEW